ncbi:hypothetical protein LX64_02620 [Chitinophaga skermanii]|uniref:Major facilitator superfamily (MFS) profile domain-containing protein n=1 Tax=Chitinophaga skermanii TaxID=331697 RepID=A0A327QP92_9BACT|nr:MFS transporter [Chitinophaga skermanii]RAJ05462.1 hypothetical protein LX64_02620 [Chitinophaga skermanii]
MKIEQQHSANTVQIIVLGLAQVLLWGGSYFLLSVISGKVMAETGYSYQMVFGCLSVALLISGLLLPRIGRMINTTTHNFALLYAGVVMALGLVIVGLSMNFVMFLLGWAIIGVGMGMGLYDALFATLGKQYGDKARRSIVLVTLIASLTPSIAWWMSNQLLVHFGWRNTCFIFAGILAISIYPAHKWVFRYQHHTSSNNATTREVVPTDLFQSKIYYLLLTSFTIGALMTTAIIVHLIDIVSTKKIDMQQVLFIVAFLGPSQSAARMFELFLPKMSAIEIAIISSCSMLLGVILIFFTPGITLLGVILFGVGNGMRSVLRGTLPLAIFGKSHYALIIGKLARMPLILQACAPFIGGFLMQQFGVHIFLSILAGLGLVNILITFFIKQTMQLAPVKTPSKVS